MKNYFGLFLFLISFNALAGGKSAVLVLRAVVPPSYKVKVLMSPKGPTAEIYSNFKGHQPLPQALITKSHNKYLVSITHP